MIAVLGAGPHGRQLKQLLAPASLYDDRLPGFGPTADGAVRHPWVLGAAWPHVRRQIAGQGLGGVPFEDGIVVFPGAQLGVDVVLGHHTHVEFNAVVSHGCVVGDFVTICPGVVLAGEVTVGDDCFVGAGAVVLHGGIKVGEGALIGAGTVVTRDVEPGAVVAGVPARRIR